MRSPFSRRKVMSMVPRHPDQDASLPGARRRLFPVLVLPLLLGLAAWGAYQLSAPKETALAAAAARENDAPPEPRPPAQGREQANQAAEPNRIRAPELTGGVDWLNTAGPVTLRDLRGKFVLLDFWTLCC